MILMSTILVKSLQLQIVVVATRFSTIPGDTRGIQDTQLRGLHLLLAAVVRWRHELKLAQSMRQYCHEEG